jgi:hypothetical protein
MASKPLLRLFPFPFSLAELSSLPALLVLLLLLLLLMSIALLLLLLLLLLFVLLLLLLLLDREVTEPCWMSENDPIRE